MKQSNNFARSRSEHFFRHLWSCDCSTSVTFDQKNEAIVMFPSQGQVKDLQRELEDSRAAQKEVLASAREAERRSKAMEADIMQLQEVRPRGERPPSLIKHFVKFGLICDVFSVSTGLSRCWQQLRELGSRRRRKETSCLKNWPVTRLESERLLIHVSIIRAGINRHLLLFLRLF